ncbi:MAG: hypothetical protein E7314_04855 [Clostridiales bacterium]|nr:hypothetical protein [Clostridiales bacterium]
MAKEKFEKQPRTLEECRKSFEAIHEKHNEPLDATTVALFEKRFKGELHGFAIVKTQKED